MILICPAKNWFLNYIHTILKSRNFTTYSDISLFDRQDGRLACLPIGKLLPQIPPNLLPDTINVGRSKPCNLFIRAKPCHLPFRIVTCVPFDQLYGILTAAFSFQITDNMFVSQRLHRFEGFVVTRREKSADFIDKPILDHLMCPLINFFIQ